jgi:hypothetical protein
MYAISAFHSEGVCADKDLGLVAKAQRVATRTGRGRIVDGVISDYECNFLVLHGI